MFINDILRKSSVLRCLGQFRSRPPGAPVVGSEAMLDDCQRLAKRCLSFSPLAILDPKQPLDASEIGYDKVRRRQGVQCLKRHAR